MWIRLFLFNSLVFGGFYDFSYMVIIMRDFFLLLSDKFRIPSYFKSDVCAARALGVIGAPSLRAQCVFQGLVFTHISCAHYARVRAHYARALHTCSRGNFSLFCV